MIESLQFVFCFEKKSGVLVERVDPEKRPRNVVRSVCERHVRKVGDYAFPRGVICFEDRHQKISNSVVELSLEPRMNPVLFDPPAGSIELSLCSGKSEPPRLSSGRVRPLPQEA